MRNKKIKKVIFTIVFVLVIIQCLWSSNHYSKSGMVWEANGNSITVRLSNGEFCSVSSQKNFDRFEKVNVIFDTNGTLDESDDTIIKVK
jgi:hypothetical protein